MLIRPHGDDAGDATGYDVMKKLLSLRPLPDAVFCHNDPTALGAMKAILDAGLKIPEDIAIVGCGNVKYSDCLRVPLTTIDQDCEAIGERAPSSPSLLDSKTLPRPKTILLSQGSSCATLPAVNLHIRARRPRVWNSRLLPSWNARCRRLVTAVRMDRQSSRSRPPPAIREGLRGLRRIVTVWITSRSRNQ